MERILTKYLCLFVAVIILISPGVLGRYFRNPLIIPIVGAIYVPLYFLGMHVRPLFTQHFLADAAGFMLRRSPSRGSGHSMIPTSVTLHAFTFAHGDEWQRTALTLTHGDNNAAGTAHWAVFLHNSPF